MHKYTKHFFLIYSLIFSVFQSYASEKDFEITHTHIELSEINLKTKTIKGFAELDMNTSNSYLKRIQLHLAASLIIDSIVASEPVIGHFHSGHTLRIEFLRSLEKQKNVALKIYYSGSPEKDPGGWGGFYFEEDAAFNLGVGFTANPHPYGRAWFPTVDDFQTKSTYSFHITTPENLTAVCNGHLIKTETLKNRKIWQYELKQPICSYLVSLAVGKYVFVNDTVMGINGITKIRLAAEAKDTNNMKQSFANLKKAFHGFEHWYGPHPFDLIGFTLIPFKGGAMEHATNIAYPQNAANGTLNRETLMAHELAHHWWGNYITCINAENMWINEAFASYSEKLFTEWVYGKEAYQQSMLKTQSEVLQFAHLRDGSALPIYGISHEHTYGTHVYKKGATAIHSLRQILGDSLFALCLKRLLNEKAWQSVHTSQLESIFSRVSGFDLSQYFQDYIYEKGFPHVEIIKWEKISESILKLYTRQSPRFRKEVYASLQLELSIFDNNFKNEKHLLFINKRLDTFTLVSGLNPEFLCLDCENKKSTASIIEKYFFDSIGYYEFENSYAAIDMKVNNGNSIIAIKHHWNKPTNLPSGSPMPVVSSDRYWTVNGVWAKDFLADLIFEYDGRSGGPFKSGEGYLDHNLMRVSEDSLVLMYRLSK
jgi:aminopeptidase N